MSHGEVRKVLEKRWNADAKVFEYHIDWAGAWPRTWEPEEHIQHAKDALKEYVRRSNEDETSQKKKRKRKEA